MVAPMSSATEVITKKKSNTSDTLLRTSKPTANEMIFFNVYERLLKVTQWL